MICRKARTERAGGYGGKPKERKSAVEGLRMLSIKREKRKNGPVMRRDRYELAGGQGSLEYLTFPGLEKTGVVRHLVSTRLGGVSEGEFSSMNLSFSRGDEEDRVRENYRRIGEALGCEPEDMTATRQTHTANIRRVTLEDRGKGITVPADYENVDGLMTDQRGIVLAAYFADCVPLFFVDPVHRAVGLAHSGWRGTAAGMGEQMVKAMGEAYGTRPEELYAAIGPCICGDCYEVGEEVAVRFSECGVRLGKRPGKYQLDLKEANRRMLLRAGVREERIEAADLCTCCNPEYLFSHRASGGRRGSLAGFLGLL
ncbi:MAG: peptidoglycan editing factor PgeF [Roseburia sp.]|nr:peptidoglycan editing factor PgeF [Roseburia sp.]MCM1099359.1 peptidoglycan editing factor PgeF [Ruminococcus flavefaciens]